MSIDPGTELRRVELPLISRGYVTEIPNPSSVLTADAVYDSFNVEFDLGIPSKRQGYNTPLITSNLATGFPKLIDEFIDGTNKQWLILATTDKILVYDVAGATVTDKTPVTGWACLVTDPVRGQSFFGRYYITNTKNTPAQWDGGAGLFVSLTGVGIPEKAYDVKDFQSHLMWFRVTQGGNDFPRLIVWSDFQNGLVYDPTAGTQEAGLLQLSGDDDILGAAVEYNICTIVRRKSVWLSQFIGSPFFYRFEQKIAGRGGISTGSIIATPYGVAALMNGEIMLSAGGQPSFIGFNILPDIKSINTLNANSAFGFYDDQDNALRFFISLYRSDGIPDVEFKYSFNDGSTNWRRHNYFDFVTAIGKFKYGVYPRWTDLPNGWNTYSLLWNSPLSGGTNLILYGISPKLGAITNVQYCSKFPTLNDRGNAIQAYYKTGYSDLQYEGFKELTRLEFDIPRGLGGNLTIYVFGSSDGYIFDQYGPFTISLSAISSTGRPAIPFIDLSAWGKFFALYVVNNELNVNFVVRKAIAYYLPSVLI